MEIIAHRGASDSAPENTLPAILLAWEQGADAVEVDIRLSRDGQIVVIHDGDTHRTGRRPWRVKDRTLTELQALDVGRWKGVKWESTRIPTLDEAAQAIPPGKRLVIEIKCGPEIIPELEEVLARSGKDRRQFAVIGFSLPTMRRVKERLPGVEAGWLCVLKGLTARGAARDAEKLARRAREAGMDALCFRASRAISARLVEKVKAAGLTPYVWAVNTVRAARRLAKFGIQGVTTNRPRRLRERLMKIRETNDISTAHAESEATASTPDQPSGQLNTRV